MGRVKKGREGGEGGEGDGRGEAKYTAARKRSRTLAELYMGAPTPSLILGFFLGDEHIELYALLATTFGAGRRGYEKCNHPPRRPHRHRKPIIWRTPSSPERGTALPACHTIDAIGFAASHR